MTGTAALGILRNSTVTTRTSRACETHRRAVGIAAQVSRCLGIISTWIAVTLVSISLATANDNSSPSLRGYQWDFGRSDDEDFNSVPDGWLRRKGVKYPNYVKIEIAAHDPLLESNIRSFDTAMVKAWRSVQALIPSVSSLPPSLTDLIVDRFLLVELDGGLAEIQSPHMPTSQLFQYRFSCRLMTEGLKYDAAHASLVFLDAELKEVQVLDTPVITGTTPWRRVEIDRVRPPQNAKHMCVRLIVSGSEDGIQDIRGRIGIDDIRIEPFPQLQITTDEPLGVYDLGKPIVATAKILGMPVDSSLVEFRLLDHRGVELHRHQAEIHSSPDPSNAINSTKSSTKKNADGSPTATWTLPPITSGFYRIASAFVDDHSTSLATDTTIAVIEPLRIGEVAGPFGWALPQGSQGIDTRELTAWLTKLGVAWLKYPCWTAPEDTVALERNAVLVGRMQSVGIQMVGVLDAPPTSELVHYEIQSPRDALIANLFRDRAVWQQRLEPIMSQLTLKVRHWQLGADDDQSFLGRPRLQEQVSSIRTGLQGFGQSIDVAISWPWMEPMLSAEESSWQATSRTSDRNPLTAAELDATLDVEARAKTGREPQTWLSLDAIDANRYERNTRIADLVMRMAAIRNHDVQLATIRDPYDSRFGLLREDGRPSDLLLPWRTSSLLLGDTRFVGTLSLQNGSNNQVFAGPSRAVVMMWSPTKKVEEIYLGKDVKQVDVWGHVSPVPVVDHAGHEAQRIETGPMPIFLIGVDATLLAFRMSVAIAETTLDSFLGQVQPLHVVYTNPTRDSMVGEMRIRHPDAWQVDSPTRSWELLGGKSATQGFDIVLGNSAMIGEYDIALDFQFQTTPPREITVYRKVNVGVAGLSVKLKSRITNDNELQVTVEMTNTSPKALSYDCMLFPPPGRQYQRRYIRVAPMETTARDFFFSNGSELVGGRVLLRAVEQDGRRVLNYDAEVTP